MSKIRVLIADDHQVVREGLERVIAHEADLRVAALAADGEEAVCAAIEHAPHVAVVDMRMPILGGVALIRRLRERCPALRVLVLSMYEDERYRKAALGAGAHAYLSKRAGVSSLLRAIRSLHAHGSFEDLSAHDAATGSELEREGQTLSAREREIMGLLAAGYTQRAAADALGISKSSVETYRARIFRKLGVENRVELLSRIGAQRSDAGLIDDEGEVGP
jgi:two-component system response regulator NreC